MSAYASTSPIDVTWVTTVSLESIPVTGAAMSNLQLGGTIRARVGTAFLLGGLLVAGPVTGTTTAASAASQQPAQLRLIRDWTSIADTVLSQNIELAAHSAPTLARSDRDRIRWLHEESGLTWDQLGRVFGVSRRAVHMWATGGRMNASNSGLLAELVALVRSLPATDPTGRRGALLAVGPTGRSPVDEFRARHFGAEAPVSGPGFRPDQLLGALHDRPTDRS